MRVWRTVPGLFLFLTLLMGCGIPVGTTPTPAATAMPTLVPARTATPAGRLDLSVIYPGTDSEIEMGQLIKFTVQVTDAQGRAVADAQVTITVRDPSGKTVATVRGAHGSEGIYRTDYWTLPHRVLEGTWSLLAEVQVNDTRGSVSGSFKVRNSTSEVLLAKYGFWLDEPSLGGNSSFINAERGDAQNGMIRWGGSRPPGTMHFAPSAFVEVHWREGNRGLENAEAVRRFILEELGPPIFVRRIDPAEPFRFQHWDAWRVAFSTLKPQEVEWVLFYAPEMDKTFAIGTDVLLPPSGINPHGVLRHSFAVFPEIQATGVAPKPLPRLPPGPELISPPLAARFQGTGQPIVLQWQPVKQLAEDEYYEVAVDYYYREANPVIKFITRETQITLPETLYHAPNCHVFNWCVTLKRQTGVGDDGQPTGEAITHPSLYSYIWWQYPPGEQPFPPLCPYTHRD